MKGKKQIVCILLGAAAFAAAKISSWSEYGDITSLNRPSYGQGDVSYQVIVEGLEEEEIPLIINVSDRLIGEEEWDETGRQIIDSLPERILGENQSLQEVRTDLNLISWIDEYGIKARWDTDCPEILDSFGHITAEELSDRGDQVILTVTLSQGTIKSEYEIPITVYPARLTDKEESAAGLGKVLSALDEQSRTGEELKLPKEYEGKELHYRMPDDSGHSVLLVLGILLAVLCAAKEKMDARQREKRRRSQMMLDYSEIVSKLMIFIGAGMTVSMAWERVALDYEKMRAEGRKEMRFAYEELCTAYYQIKSGISEGKAYRDFGRRAGLGCYLKLSGLLEQNRKTGMKNLKVLLDAEMEDAFEQRKNLAKKLGEEAGTKLLLPLFMMLGVVMVIIMVPALMSMY
ncbi:hypothetical protein C0033_16620 [Clostridium sp. chh4-2]|uniref:hypothetical protein n=1 Tax=Clostridium sp. chh4-2 TaxID=2067550 RepID=UPI000CCDD77A|nr:hypothetical protein [Clostridium sp. chh4-2]PNV60816.1 hypothetical protein C0033_16620 [Clostridium sp. chh4-2]